MIEARGGLGLGEPRAAVREGLGRAGPGCPGRGRSSRRDGSSFCKGLWLSRWLVPTWRNTPVRRKRRGLGKVEPGSESAGGSPALRLPLNFSAPPVTQSRASPGAQGAFFYLKMVIKCRFLMLFETRTRTTE